MDTHSVLEGSNDYQLLASVYSSISPPENDSQERFAMAWEVADYISSDGFEWLFEQEFSLDEFVELFDEIGFPEGSAYIRKAEALVPDALLRDKDGTALFEHIHAQFEHFKLLLYDYLDHAEPLLLPAFGNYLRRNQRDFAGPLAESRSF